MYGQVLKPEQVGAVEATFDTGRTLRDDVAGGVFALYGSGASDAREIRVLDKQGRVLELLDNLALPRVTPVP